MGKRYEEFIAKWMTDNGIYVPGGAKCGICGKKLGFFATGLWSTNAKHVADSPICAACNEKVSALLFRKSEWMPKDSRKAAGWKKYTKTNWHRMTAEEVRGLLDFKAQCDAELLSGLGGATSALTVSYSFAISPTSYEVGIRRAKKMNEKTVVYGAMEQGVIKKGDAVRVVGKKGDIETTVIEAYMDDNVNDFKLLLSASGGKQLLSGEQSGWLILDTGEEMCSGDRVVK